MRKILVTGATGFIGQYVVAALLQGGHAVIASSSSAEKAQKLPWFSKVQYKPLDLGAMEAGTDYFQYFDRPDAVIHLAWEGLPNYKASFHVDVNLPRHIDFVNNLLRHGLKDITITGTCFEYGMREGELSEDMPAAPANHYAMAKDRLRRHLQEQQEQYPFSFKWARLFYMYGEGQNPNSLLSQLDKALQNGDRTFNMSGGEQVRDYLPVEKMAAYIVEIALQNKVDGIINCCSGKPVTVKSRVEDYLKQKNKSITLNLGYYPYPDYEAMRFWGDTGKLNSIISKL